MTALSRILDIAGQVFAGVAIVIALYVLVFE